MPDIKVEATNAAQRILSEYWADSIPVDPARIARKMGMEVANAYLDPDVAGAVEKRAGKVPHIYLSASDHPNRQRFTCAHEVGHVVKHENDGDFEFVDYRDMTASMGIDEDERYANAFAAALLMPEAQVRRLRQLGMNEADMSVQLGVSEAAMVNRLKNLGLYRS